MKTKQYASQEPPQQKPVEPTLEPTPRNKEEQEMYDAATLLGEDEDGCDVEFAFFAQAEVVLASPQTFKKQAKNMPGFS